MTECVRVFFFFNDTATTKIYTLSLHDALPIFQQSDRRQHQRGDRGAGADQGGRQPEDALGQPRQGGGSDRKSTRLNSSHANISYAVFCLKTKKILLYHYSTPLSPLIHHASTLF